MDPVADMLTSIRNAQAAKKESLSIPFSKLKYDIAKIIEKKGFVEKVETERKKVRKTLKITLKYGDSGEPGIFGLKRISKPGQRIYKGFGEIKRVKGGHGIAIISTSKGLMTDKEARKQRLGGEEICEVW
ncbi:MAG: small subunit ribosomal protein S8 [Parcubacteria group bacterium Gr01-1014_30]|nr:MAG: small subunit ribosomal protein S8 [Parcubacteria group bacterium Gr01-1014_30]